MSMTDASTLVEHHLALMNAPTIRDDESAHLALANAMAAVGGMNQGLGMSTESTIAFGNPADAIIKKLQEWIKQLVDKLTEIATRLKATFSLTVGASVSVTINFGPFL